MRIRDLSEVWTWFFLLNEELERLPSILTPYGHECLVRLAGWMPFEKATVLFEDWMGISVSKSICH